MEIGELISIFAPEGICAVLSLSLIFYIIKGQEHRDERQDERDKKYQETILQMANALQYLSEIKSILYERLKN